MVIKNTQRFIIQTVDDWKAKLEFIVAIWKEWNKKNRNNIFFVKKKYNQKVCITTFSVSFEDSEVKIVDIILFFFLKA